MTKVPLRNGAWVEVDDDVALTMVGEAWNVTTAGVVSRSYWDRELKRPQREALSHRVTGGAAPQGMVWTHADGDWQNFRRDNLVPKQRGKHHPRALGAMSREELIAVQRKGAATRRGQPGRRATRSNTLGYRGVHAAGKKFRAVATVGGKQTYLGVFDTPAEAARAYDEALVKQNLAPVNFKLNDRSARRGE